MNVKDYLKIFYMYIDITQVESVFGNTQFPSRLYGGRTYKLRHSFTDSHVQQLTELGMGLSLTLTNHFFDDASYEHSREFLNAHHKKGNSIICANDELAARIRKEFPLYTLKASIIKQIDTIEKIERHLEIYDFVVPPMDKNDDDAFLQAIKEKDRVILFGNANCAYNCPVRSCYVGFSQKHQGLPVTGVCSKSKLSRLDLGSVYFDVKKFKEMGFCHFKLVPLAPPQAEAIAIHFSRNRTDWDDSGRKKI